MEDPQHGEERWSEAGLFIVGSSLVGASALAVLAALFRGPSWRALLAGGTASVALVGFGAGARRVLRNRVPTRGFEAFTEAALSPWTDQVLLPRLTRLSWAFLQTQSSLSSLSASAAALAVGDDSALEQLADLQAQAKGRSVQLHVLLGVGAIGMVASAGALLVLLAADSRRRWVASAAAGVAAFSLFNGGYLAGCSVEMEYEAERLGVELAVRQSALDQVGEAVAALGSPATYASEASSAASALYSFFRGGGGRAR